MTKRMSSLDTSVWVTIRTKPKNGLTRTMQRSSSPKKSASRSVTCLILSQNWVHVEYSGFILMRRMLVCTRFRSTEQTLLLQELIAVEGEKGRKKELHWRMEMRMVHLLPSANSRAWVWSSASRLTILLSATIPAEATTPDWRIAPPKTFLHLTALSMNSFDPATKLPIGHPSPCNLKINEP